MRRQGRCSVRCGGRHGLSFHTASADPVFAPRAHIQLVSLFCMLMLITYIPMAELTMQPFACVRGMDREPTPMITHSTLRLLWADTPPSVVQRWSG